jgi:DNA replication protein DnaC
MDRGIQTGIVDVTGKTLTLQSVALLIAGPCGAGKSHLAQATGTYERRFNYRAKVPLLPIDDFGPRSLRSPEDENFHDPIAERYERTATILESNLDFDEGGAAFPANKMIGAATLDRLLHGAYKIALDGESYRALPPASAKSKPPSEKGRKSAAPRRPSAGRPVSMGAADDG